MSIDNMILNDNWSDLRQYQGMPDIDMERLYAYRLERIKAELRENELAMCVLVNPISLRYAVDYHCYSLFQAHIPTTYLFVSVDGPTVIHGAYIDSSLVDEVRPGQPLSVFDGGFELEQSAKLFARDIARYLLEIDSDNRRVALEYVNPSITQALMKSGLEVVDGVVIAEQARVIKSKEEMDCMRWAISVAEHGITMMQQALKPGVREVQLWGILNYANLANSGGWHEGRMLSSGDRINPWLQEASQRAVEAGDLVGFDTDMVGPYGYFADISRTFFCGPGQPSKRQKQLYQLAVDEIEHNLSLIRPGLSFGEFQKQAFMPPEEFHENAYPCVLHAVGMCDEYPRINPVFRGPNPYDGEFSAGMVLCIESYIGAAQERDGVKLEQQILVTETGYELLSTFPYDEKLLD
ncbi:MAG: M24 family metallopeptidase [Arenicella sp.]